MSILAPSLRSVATATTVAVGELLLVDATAAARVITLPSARDARARGPLTVKKIDASANAVTVTRAGTSTIDGATTFAITVQYKAVTLVSDGTNWHVIAAV